MPKPKLVVKKTFIALNIFVVFIYLLTCFIPFLNAGKFWFIAILGLIFPVLFLLVICFFTAWLLARSRWCMLSLIALLLSMQQIFAVFSLHTNQPFTKTKSAVNLRILSWNVSSWDELNTIKNGGSSYRQQMFEEVKKSQADVLCFQEFLETNDTILFAPTIPELTKMGYPFHYYVPSYSEVKNTELGITIFSKYPITNTGIFDFGDEVSVQQLIYTDINFNEKTVRLFTIHLQSVHFGGQEYESLNEIKHSNRNGLKDSRTIIGKLKRGYKFRSMQADTIHNIVQRSPYPVMLCGDFNDVPNSYTYFKIKGNMQDAFLQKGSGIGRTFRFISPTLRIDYIFADNNFSVNQYRRITVPYSDHYGIIADVSLK